MLTDDDELPKPAAGWVAHRDPTTYKAAPVPTIKAYKNPNFLSSPHARSFRMMAEYEETMQRLAANGIRATVRECLSRTLSMQRHWPIALVRLRLSLTPLRAPV